MDLSIIYADERDDPSRTSCSLDDLGSNSIKDEIEEKEV
jgi:hypothetical protein